MAIVAIVDAGLLLVVAGFQVLLAMGKPYGEAAFGGQHPGVLPNRLRTVSAFAAPIWIVVMVAVLWRGDVLPTNPESQFIVVTVWLVTVLMAVATLMNAISRSRKERILWTPIAGSIFALTLILSMS